MEKLQVALDKARSQRHGTVPESQQRGQARGTAVVGENWDAIQVFNPLPKTLLKNLIFTSEANAKAMPYDALRTKTIVHMRKQNWNRLAITSPMPGCGKTQVACNLALSMTRQPDMRVLLFEMDLRRPSIAKMLGAQPEHDVTELLSGKVSFEDQALRIGNSNVAICMATRSSQDPMQFLLSATTQSTLKSIESRYQPDLIIFDMPPLLADGDTMTFLGEVDCALAVARASVSTVAQIDACERGIAEHTHVLGIVLNQCRYGYQTTGARDRSL